MALGLLAAKAGAFDIVSGGIGRVSIVTPEKGTPVVRYASSELQKHIKLATGVELPIISDSEVSGMTEPMIFVGPCQQLTDMNVRIQDLSKNEYVIKTSDQSIVLAGKDDYINPLRDDYGSMGSLLAVNKWLRHHLGVRWIWPGDLGIFVPKQDVLRSGANGEEIGRPQLAHARLRFSDEGTGSWTWESSGGPERRKRFALENSAWLRRHEFVRTISLEYDHAFTHYWERFGPEHPEFFAQQKGGKRGPVDSRIDLVQMCVSSPGLQDQIIADWIKQREADPSRIWINGCENDRRDIDLACHCEKCQAWDSKLASKVSDGNQWFIQASKADSAADVDEERSVSDRYAKFWLELQKKGEKTDPKATVFGLAYAGYTDPPLETKLNDRIVVGIVPPYDLPTDANDRNRFRNIWDGWAGAGAKLFLRPNYTLDGYCLPYVFPHQLAEEYVHAANHGMIATDFDSLTSMWGVQGPTVYVLGRLNENPDVPVDQLLGEFYSAFGPAADDIKGYFDFWEGVTLERDAAFNKKYTSGWATMSRYGNVLFTPEKFAQGREFLTAALEKTSDSGEFADRVKYLSVWLTQAELSMKALTAHQNYLKSQTPENQQSLDQAKKEVDKFREAHPNEFSAANLPLLNQLEQWVGWRSR